VWATRLVSTLSRTQLSSVGHGHFLVLVVVIALDRDRVLSNTLSVFFGVNIQPRNLYNSTARVYTEM